MKPGYKTTEFWLAFLVDAALVFTTVTTGSPTIPGIASAAYSLARSLAKGGLLRGSVGRALQDPEGRLSSGDRGR